MDNNPNSNGKPYPRLVKNILLFSIIALFVVLLGILIYEGTFIRYMADDYCYGAEVQKLGFWKTQINSYLNRMPFNSNRYSLTLTHSIVEILGGPYFAPWVPGLSIIAWVSGIFFLIIQISKIYKLNIDSKITLISSVTVVFFSLFLAPNQYQILYWLSGSLTYLLPLILTVALIGVFLKFFHEKKDKYSHLLLIGLFTFIVGGYSETTALLLLTLLVFLTILFFITRKVNLQFKRLIISSFIGIILAIILLVASPPNALDFEAGNWNQPDLMTLVVGSLGNTRLFVSRSIKFLKTPFFVIGCLGLWLGWASREDEKNQPAHLLVHAFSILGVSFFLIFSTMLPTMLAMSSYPGDRALIPGMFILVCCVFMFCWKIARYLSVSLIFLKIKKPLNWLLPISSLTIFIFGFYIFPMLTKNTTNLRARAEDWDFRHEILINAKMEGLNEVKIPGFESIGDILEFSQNHHMWVNNCGESYYQVNQIEAHTKYLGIPTHPIIP